MLRPFLNLVPGCVIDNKKAIIGILKENARNIHNWELRNFWKGSVSSRQSDKELFKFWSKQNYPNPFEWTRISSLTREYYFTFPCFWRRPNIQKNNLWNFFSATTCLTFSFFCYILVVISSSSMPSVFETSQRNKRAIWKYEKSADFVSLYQLR